MTINSLNYESVEDLTHEWIGKVNKIGFQFHIPFVKGDPLWMPFGDKRNNVIERLTTPKKRNIPTLSLMVLSNYH
jgi:Fe-coproporphyrin III synthase